MDLNHPSSLGFSDLTAGDWVDPAEERARLRRRLRRYRLGFSCLCLALVVASLATIGWLILILSQRGQPLGAVLGIPHWDLIEESTIVWGTVIGGCLIWGPWPDRNWQRRSGLLLLMFLVDAVLWSLDHATELGLTEVKVGHDWFRHSLGMALGWSEFALIASLTADMAAHLGEPQAVEFGKATRSLATTGAMVWFLYFYFRTDWRAPIWPLRDRPPNPGSAMLGLGYTVLVAINLVQVTALSLLAGRSCGRALREMAQEDRRHDLPPSRSEAGWDEFTRSGPKGGT
jgi:hypothetical protein